VKNYEVETKKAANVDVSRGASGQKEKTAPKGKTNRSNDNWGGRTKEVPDGIKREYKGHTPWPQCIFCQIPRPSHLPENCWANKINKKTPEVNTHRVAVASRVLGGGRSWENMFGSVSNNFDCLSENEVNSWDFDIKCLFNDAPQNDKTIKKGMGGFFVTINGCYIRNRQRQITKNCAAHCWFYPVSVEIP